MASEALEALREMTRPPEKRASEIARLCGVTPQTVSQWLAGKTTPTVERQELLWEAMGRDPRFHPSKWETSRKRRSRSEQDEAA